MNIDIENLLDRAISRLLGALASIPKRTVIALLRLPPLIYLVWRIHFLQCWVSYIFSSNDGAILDGEKSLNSGRYLFYIVVGNRIDVSPWRDATAVFTNAGYQVVLIINGEASANINIEEEPSIAAILRRKNKGYDFGGWKTAFKKVIGDGTSLQDDSEVLLMNDSVYFPVTNPQRFMTWLKSEFGFGGAIINLERDNQPHMQSFFLSFKGRTSIELARSFFGKYLPLTSRVWAINNGEVALSRFMLSKKVVYSSYVSVVRILSRFDNEVNLTHRAPLDLIRTEDFPFLKYDLASRFINPHAVSQIIQGWDEFDVRHLKMASALNEDYKEITERRTVAKNYLMRLLISERPSLVNRLLSIYGIR